MSDFVVVKPPRNEVVWTTYYDNGGHPILITTSKEARDCYFLYEVSNGKLTKLGKAASPLDLEAKFKVNERMDCV